MLTLRIGGSGLFAWIGRTALSWTYFMNMINTYIRYGSYFLSQLACSCHNRHKWRILTLEFKSYGIEIVASYAIGDLCLNNTILLLSPILEILQRTLLFRHQRNIFTE